MKYKLAVAACAVTAIASLGVLAFTACFNADCNHKYVDNKCARCGDVITSDGLAYELNEDGQSYKVIGLGTFEGKHISVPETYNGKPVTTVGEYAFSFDDQIHTIVLPDTLTTIENSALAGTGNLTDIRVPATLTDIGSSFISFSAYFENKENWRNGVLYLTAKDYKTKYLLHSDEKTLPTDVKIEKNTTIIAPYAFQGNEKILKITIPDGVWKISDHAFQYCTVAKEIYVPDSVIYIGNYAFDNTQELEKIHLSRNATYIGDYCFYRSMMLKELVLGSKITHIGKDAFTDSGFAASNDNEDNWNWEKNTFYLESEDKSVKYLYCAGITSKFTIDEKTTLIANNALTFLEPLESFTIPKSVQAIGQQAFSFSFCREIVFEDPNGWTVDGIAIPSSDLQDGKIVADYLQNTYLNAEWLKK